MKFHKFTITPRTITTPQQSNFKNFPLHTFTNKQFHFQFTTKHIKTIFPTTKKKTTNPPKSRPKESRKRINTPPVVRNDTKRVLNAPISGFVPVSANVANRKHYREE